MYADTGRYTCYYENAHVYNSWNTSIHIYVSDKNHLFAPPNANFNPQNPVGFFMVVHQGRPAVIPCKPTATNVKVKLFKGKLIITFKYLTL